LNLHGLYCAIHLSFANNLIYGFLQHNLQSAKVQYSRAVDNIMSLHAKGKGIIHTSGIEFHQRKYIAAKCTKAFGNRPRYTKR